MPRYPKRRWRDFKIEVYPESAWKALPFVPFLWDSPTSVVLRVKSVRGKKLNNPTYTWRLQDGNDKTVGSAQDTYEKPCVLRFGYLRPHQTYELSVVLSDGDYVSPRFPVAYFTVKDRDEIYTQILIGIIVIVAGVVIGFIARGCS